MDEVVAAARAWVDQGSYVPLLQALATIAIGVLLARLAGSAARRVVQGRANAQQAMVARRAAFHAVLAVAAIAALRQLGFDLSVLLGAAGILTVAIGFASQTSASNLISGLFLLGERPFVVGDVIKVGETTGEVVSLDLLSMTLRTFDNLAVRIPNETLLKAEITNFTRFPIRRVDVQLGVAYREDLENVRRVLDEVAAALPLCLDEPRPLFIVRGFADSAIDLQYSVWARRDSYLDVANAIRQGIHEAFRREGIEIPFPQQVVHPGNPAPPPS